jgi:hypothetical protein
MAWKLLCFSDCHKVFKGEFIMKTLKFTLAVIGVFATVTAQAASSGTLLLVVAP